MKIVLLVLLCVPFVVKANDQCPWGTQVQCNQRASEKSCISKTLQSMIPKRKSSSWTTACQSYKRAASSVCSYNCPSASCVTCMDNAVKVVENCKQFYSRTRKRDEWGKCSSLERTLIDSCGCKICRNSFCQNGGGCRGGPNYISCKCRPGFTGTYCQKGHCETKCQNGGKCIGRNACKCTADYKGIICERKRLGTKLNPAPNAQAILDAGDSVGSGLYWIQPPGEKKSAQTYCDMAYSDGGWMLASYGYVANTTTSADNKAIPNMNNPMGYHWRPDKRASRSGVINLSHGAVMMARNATYMMMAAGNNPNTAGIDQYTHIYRIDLRQNSEKITFANHNAVHGATGSNGTKMHVSDFLVVGLKGDVGEFERFALAESLGVTWTDTYPTGYGFNDMGLHASSFDKGPFFPSVHSGDGHDTCHGAPCRVYVPDVTQGSESYVHRGWYSATGVNNLGQTSIWFK